MDSAENSVPVLSPDHQKPMDEDFLGFQSDLTDIHSTGIEHTPHTAKTEKGSSEEGFCCVMSMHDGIVL